MRDQNRSERERLARVLLAVFVFALWMGPGPGIYLINPGPAEPTALFGDIPAVYAWTVFWFFVQAAVVLVAARYLWRVEDGE